MNDTKTIEKTACIKNMKNLFSASGLVLLFVFGGTAVAQSYFDKIATPAELQTVTPNIAPTPVDTNQVERVDIGTPGLPPEPSGADKYNMALGPVHFGIAAGIGLMYNDNITLAPRDQAISDFAVLPSLTIDATYQISELNTLRLSLGASYAAYFNHSEFDTRGILLSPNSAIAFTVHVSNIAITFRDRFSYQEDGYNNPVIGGVGSVRNSGNELYRYFENQVGVQVDWAVNANLKITGGYDHYNLWTFSSQFSQLEDSIDTIYLKPGYAITPAITVGVNTSVSFVRYNESIQNDGNSYMVGPFADLSLSQNTHLYLEGGYQSFEFQNNGIIADNSNSNSWYARVDLANRPSEAFSHRLSFSKSAETGYGTNYYTLYHLEYAADWKIMQNLSLAPSAFYEHYSTSGSFGFQGETGNRYGGGVGLRYILTPSVTLGLDYRYVSKDSNLPGLNYTQNLVLLSLYYNF